MGKTVYGHQIENDSEIPNTIVRTSTLPEELGRIEYLLSDKTGTLTQNGMLLIGRPCASVHVFGSEMEMKKLHMGTMSFGYDSMDEVAHQLATSFGASAEQGTAYSAMRAQLHADTLVVALLRRGASSTGAQLATRGRRDMSSRVHDVVLSLALCHNVHDLATFYHWYMYSLLSLGHPGNQ